MKQFKDSTGRTWTISAEVASMKRVRALTGHDPLELKTFLVALSNIEDLANILFAFVQPQAEKLAVTDEEFGKGLGEDGIWDGFDAVIAELPSFFPRPERPRIAKMLKTVMEASTLALSRLADDQTPETLADQIQARLTTAKPVPPPPPPGPAAPSSGGESINAPASSD